MNLPLCDAYLVEEWKVIEDKLKTLLLTKKDARAFTCFFFSGATECELDKQGNRVACQLCET